MWRPRPLRPCRDCRLTGDAFAEENTTSQAREICAGDLVPVAPTYERTEGIGHPLWKLVPSNGVAYVRRSSTLVRAFRIRQRVEKDPCVANDQIGREERRNATFTAPGAGGVKNRR